MNDTLTPLFPTTTTATTPNKCVNDGLKKTGDGAGGLAGHGAAGADAAQEHAREGGGWGVI